MKTKTFSKLLLTSVIATSLVTTAIQPAQASIFGWLDNAELTIRSKTAGLPLTISTYDFDGQKIDQVKTKSADIHTDNTMSKSDSNGNEKSSVIDVDYGNNRMIRVGSTMIAYEGLKNYQDEFNQHVNVNDQNRSVPILNSMYQDFKNQWNSQARVVMIRSQSGKPIATFVGNHVSIHNTNMKNTTKFVIDGHQLIVYRCDYTVYPMNSIKKSVNDQEVK